MAKVYVCDLCGNKTGSVEYLVPIWINYTVYEANGKQGPASVVEDRRLNLCDNCRVAIASFLRDIELTDRISDLTK